MPELDKMINIEVWTNAVVAYGLKAVFAVMIFIFGWIAAKFLKRMAFRAMQKVNFDTTLARFLANIMYAVLMAFVAIATLNKIGIQTASLIAVIGAAGLAVGLALQGSLSNFAAGVMIILFRHFRIGDFVEAGGESGTVTNLDIFNTTLLTPDNQKVIIPNAKITEDAVTNYSAMDTRRIEMNIGIGYDDDIGKAKQAIQQVMDAEPLVIADKAKTIAVKELGASSVDLVVRCWTKTSEYWDARFALLENIKLKLDSEGITIPYPQTEIRISHYEKME
jgi:small conductance mechanosensitive channel